MKDKIQMDNVECFNYFGSLITNDAMKTCTIWVALRSSNYLKNVLEKFHEKKGFK
jgi:hypothetical protein